MISKYCVAQLAIVKNTDYSIKDQAERLAWLAEYSPLAGNRIIYCLTVADCNRVAHGCNHKILMFMNIMPN